jgi:hypothetical protein
MYGWEMYNDIGDGKKKWLLVAINWLLLARNWLLVARTWLAKVGASCTTSGIPGAPTHSKISHKIVDSS